MKPTNNPDWLDTLAALHDTLPQADTQEPSSPAPQSQTRTKLNIRTERKGRAGKTATIISGFQQETPEQISQLAATLKTRLGTGGSARGGEILIQGDRAADIRHQLTSLGYKA